MKQLDYGHSAKLVFLYTELAQCNLNFKLQFHPETQFQTKSYQGEVQSRKGMFTWYRYEFHSDTISLRCRFVALHSFIWYRYEMLYWCESYQYEFTPVLIPVRNIRTGKKSDHILYWHKQRRYEVSFRYVAELTGAGSEWLSLQNGLSERRLTWKFVSLR